MKKKKNPGRKQASVNSLNTAGLQMKQFSSRYRSKEAQFLAVEGGGRSDPPCVFRYTVKDGWLNIVKTVYPGSTVHLLRRLPRSFFYGFPPVKLPLSLYGPLSSLLSVHSFLTLSTTRISNLLCFIQQIPPSHPFLLFLFPLGGLTFVL